MENKQVIIYQTPDGKASIEVKLEQDTVWLNQSQMVALFQQTKQNISLHISNVFREGELDRNATVKESLTAHHEHDLKPEKEKIVELDNVLYELMKPEQQRDYLPNGLKRKRKKAQIRKRW